MKLLKTLLIIIPLVCFIGVAVAFIVYYAGSTGGLEYSLNEDGQSYTVTGIGTASVYKLKIPASHDGKPVTAIGEYAFEDCTDITKVIIPESVTSIGRHAFNNCQSLVSVTFKNTTGWKAGTNSISDGFLSNTQMAADLLNFTYCNYHWQRT